MEKEFTIAIVVGAIILLSVVAVPPVMSEVGDENGTNLSETKTNGDYFQMTIREALISGSCIGTGTTAPVMSEERDKNETKTNVNKTRDDSTAKYIYGNETELEPPVNIAAGEKPIACFNVSPYIGDLSTIFNVDASCSSDFENPITALQVR